MECPSCGHAFLPGDDACSACHADLTRIDMPRPKHGRLHEMILEDPISQLNAPEPICLAPTDGVLEAIRRMRRMRYGSALVVDGGQLVGILTEYDIVRLPDGDLSQLTMADVMTRDPDTLREDDTLAVALHHMAVGGFRHIPVVEDGAPRGFISIRGILAYLEDNALDPSP